MQAECPIILIGMMGAGKTTIGRLVSHFSALSTDSDAVIEEEHRCDVSSFFTRYGEVAFRTCEEETVSRLVRVSPVSWLSVGVPCCPVRCVGSSFNKVSSFGYVPM